MPKGIDRTTTGTSGHSIAAWNDRGIRTDADPKFSRRTNWKDTDHGAQSYTRAHSRECRCGTNPPKESQSPFFFDERCFSASRFSVLLSARICPCLLEASAWKA